MHVQACLFARKDLESSFHHCAGPVKLVKVCLRVSFQRSAGAVKLV